MQVGGKQYHKQSVFTVWGIVVIQHVCRGASSSPPLQLERWRRFIHKIILHLQVRLIVILHGVDTFVEERRIYRRYGHLEFNLAFPPTRHLQGNPSLFKNTMLRESIIWISVRGYHRKLTAL